MPDPNSRVMPFEELRPEHGSPLGRAGVWCILVDTHAAMQIRPLPAPAIWQTSTAHCKLQKLNRSLNSDNWEL